MHSFTCRTCGVIHDEVPKQHTLTQDESARVMQNSNNWEERLQRARILLLRRRHQVAANPRDLA